MRSPEGMERELNYRQKVSLKIKHLEADSVLADSILLIHE
jgi:hypothetical protein